MALGAALDRDPRVGYAAVGAVAAALALIVADVVSSRGSGGSPGPE